jgi:plastocyanin
VKGGLTCIAAIAAFAALAAPAARLDVLVRNASGAPLQDAVAWAVPKSGPAPFRKREAAVEQKDRTFVPFVTVVQAGTAVSFPNRDEIRHHVFSFSTPKVFEIKLYAGTPAAPVVFDKPGEVVLGCNIHDQMLAYIYVVETPWFAKTGADGRARIDGLPAGEYDVRAWHPTQVKELSPQDLRLAGDGAAEASFSLETRALPIRARPK